MPTKPLNVATDKLGIIAGSGDLPREVIDTLKASKRDFFVVAFEGETDTATVNAAPHAWFHLGKIGKAMKRLEQEAANKIVMVGRVGRPAVSALHMDYSAVRLLAKLKKLRAQGDDAIFSAIIQFLEEHKFSVVGVDEVLPELVMPKGILGKVKPDAVAENDMKIGTRVAKEIGLLDIGQAVIIQRGQILGVEGAEGTDRL
ncbi:MAG: DUF1009 domain-containing protein, partial [Proteobacteria bacterium]|nr:DUF1009 domain-containing protein [Pseudomonadota bacterium]